MEETIRLPEPVFHAGCHEVPYHVARYPSRRSDISHDLPVAAVHGECGADLLPVIAEDLEDVRAPAHVARQGDNIVPVWARRDLSPCVFWKKEKMVSPPHDPVCPLVVYPFLTSSGKGTVENGGDPPVAEGGTGVGDLLETRGR